MSMYGDYDYNYFLRGLLARMSPDLDLREGTLPYAINSASSLEFWNQHRQLDFVLDNTYAKTAKGDWLMLRTAERNIIRKEPTFALIKGEFNTLIPLGSRFSCDGVNYVVRSSLFDEEMIEEYYYYSLECETVGLDGNKTYGTLVPVENIYNLTHSEIVEIIIPGEDVEGDESLEKRYRKTFDDLSFGGNKDDYIRFVGNINGVGIVKPFRRQKGNKTIEVIFMTSNDDIPSQELIDLVQEEVDPRTTTGEGDGTAPIWHFVNIKGVRGREINVTTKLVLANDVKWESIRGSVESNIGNYLLGLRQTWENTDNVIVRISRIESVILDVDGIIDIEDTKINGEGQNIILEADEIPILGVVFNE